MSFKSVAAGAAVLAFIFAGSAEAAPKKHAAASPAVQRQVDHQAAKLEAWISQASVWMGTFQGVLHAQAQTVEGVYRGLATSNQLLAAGDKAAAKSWADSWGAERRASYGELKATAKAFMDTGLPQPASDIAGRAEVRRVVDKLAKLPEVTHAAVVANEAHFNEAVALIQRHALGEVSERDMLIGLIALDNDAMRSENLMLEGNRAVTTSVSGGGVGADLLTASIEMNLALIGAKEFAVNQAQGLKPDRGQAAVTVRMHADAMQAAADGMPREMRTSMAKLSAQPGFAATPLYAKMRRLTGNIDQSAAVESQLAAICRGLAEKIANPSVEPGDLLAETETLAPLIQRRIDLAAERRTIMTN